MATVHIESDINDISDIVLMPGDPKRAKYIATNFLKKAKLVNSVRGMLAWTGYYKERRITVFSSGMGIPSIGIYSYELFKYYNVEKIIRIGSAGGYSDKLKLKDIILVERSYSESSYAKVMNDYFLNYIDSSSDLNKIIKSTSKELNLKIISGPIYSTDVFYEINNNYKEKMSMYNVLGVEMETFALFYNAYLLNKEATSLLTVSDLFFSDEKLTSEEREKNLNDMIILALESALKL